jgi:hypothetical protein
MLTGTWILFYIVDRIRIDRNIGYRKIIDESEPRENPNWQALVLIRGEVIGTVVDVVLVIVVVVAQRGLIVSGQRLLGPSQTAVNHHENRFSF